MALPEPSVAAPATDLPVTDVAVIVILLSMIPVYLVSRLTRDAGAFSGSR